MPKYGHWLYWDSVYRSNLSLQNLAAAVRIIQLCLHVCVVLLVLKLQGLQPLLQLLLGYLQGFDISTQLRVLGTQTTGDKITQESAGEGSDGEVRGDSRDR